MRIEPKDFQESAVVRLVEQFDAARKEAERGRPQAVVLASPTGSGKTVIMTLLMERLLNGHESIEADPDVIFLWLSDSPELNIQSRDKIEAGSDVFTRTQLVMIDNDFDRERLSRGCVYFLNTQKLGASSLLTKPGDGRTWTIWQTIENTSKASPTHFVVIVDEAHRGMSLGARADNAAMTIVQRFIKGSQEFDLSPVPLVIGMSATPERFNRVLQGSQRVVRPVNITPDDVRASGLIKDRIVLAIAEDDQPVDWTLLSDAAHRLVQYSNEWTIYCGRQGIDPSVRPILVVQVEDGSQVTPTRTDLATAVDVLESVLGRFADNELAHAFQEDHDIPAGGYRIRKIEPSRIQADPTVRVVFFKMALTTGWDCPRAEVMMSFRRAADHTLIAQLVGRMVRTPLARRVEENEFLASVTLFLPHYDEAGLRAIVERLEDPDAGSPVKVEKKAELATYIRAVDKAELFAQLARVPTYVLDSTRRLANSRRLLSMARKLTIEGIDAEAWTAAKSLVVDAIQSEARRLRRHPEFVDRVSGKATIDVKEFGIAFGEVQDLPNPRTRTIAITTANVEDLFAKCELVLGEGLKDEYWLKTHDHDDPDLAKLELFCILQDPAATRAIQDACGARLDELFARFSREIGELPSSRREQFARIGRQGEEPRAETINVPDLIELTKESRKWSGHLFVDQNASFTWRANSWEELVLTTEMEGKGFLGWLRNVPRKHWALCVPYGQGQSKPLYPDLLTFRKDQSQMRVDILDPHDDTRADAPEKAVGLANFARRHGSSFGRIELIRVVQGRIERLRLHQEAVRDKVLRVSDGRHLAELYEQLG